MSAIVEKKQDNCGGQSCGGDGNMAGRYASALTLIQHQFPKFVLLWDIFILVGTSHTNCWIHPWTSFCKSPSPGFKENKIFDLFFRIIQMRRYKDTSLFSLGLCHRFEQ